MATLKQTWSLQPHSCVKCGGRILRCETGNGMTPGGNAIKRCADCGNHTYSMMGHDICWCGMHHRNQNTTPYKCVAFSELEKFPKLLQGFQACGCDPSRGEVGIMLERDYYAAVKNDTAR